MCANFYAHFHHELSDSSYHPPGSEQMCGNRLFEMFHASTQANNKDIILKSLIEHEGVVQVVFATMALGVCVNLKGVNTVIHYGAHCHLC